jgi:hypothetical protein
MADLPLNPSLGDDRMNRRVRGDPEKPTRKWGWQERDQDFQVEQS